MTGRAVGLAPVLAAGWLSVALVASAGVGAFAAETRAGLAVELRDDAATLLDVSADMDVRSAAARRMLVLPEQEAQAALRGVLDPPEQAVAEVQAADAQAVLLREIAASCSAPAWLATPLAKLAQNGPVGRRVLAVGALGSVRTQAAAKALLAMVNDKGVPPDVAEEAYRALSRLTGRSDFGFDSAKWSSWFAKSEFLPDMEWNRQLADALAERADANAKERDRVEARLLEYQRKRYQATTGIEDRSALLEEFIKDDLGGVRRLGLQLALQELANARAPGPGVAAAALVVLRDPSPEFRRSAAEVVNVLAPASMAGAIHEALVFETDPGVAALLLQGAARWPNERSRATVLRWIEVPGPARAPAIDACAALLSVGMLENAEERSRVLSVLRSIKAEELPSSGLRLLFALGEQADRETVVALVSRADPEVRQRAADALSRDGAGLDALLGAAANDASMFPIAARSVAQHRRTPAGFAAIAALPASSPDERRQQLMLIADRLSPGELLAVARMIPDPEFRERLLSRLTSEPLHTRFMPAMGLDDETPHPEVIAGLLLLCQTRLEIGQPASALKALDALDPVKRYVDVSLRDSLRTLSLLLLGRVDEAAKLNGSPVVWVEGLEASVDEAHAPAIAAVIKERWGGKLPPELANRVLAANAEVERFTGPVSDVPRQ